MNKDRLFNLMQEIVCYTDNLEKIALGKLIESLNRAEKIKAMYKQIDKDLFQVCAMCFDDAPEKKSELLSQITRNMLTVEREFEAIVNKLDKVTYGD